MSTRCLAALSFFFILWIQSWEETESVQICGGLPSRHSKNVSSEGGGGRVYKMRWGDPPQLYIFVMGTRATRLPEDVWPFFLVSVSCPLCAQREKLNRKT